LTVLLDASVLVPLFARDALTPRALAFVAQAGQTLLVSDWAALETISAFAQKARSGAITLREAETARDNLTQWCNDFTIKLALDSSDLEAAAKLVGAFLVNLRAPDALHLAMAQRLNVMLATFDTKLAAAGRSVSVAIAP
jgi:predicted nucleic acid-binding protein